MQLVADDAELLAICRALRAERTFYLDTEFDSGRERTKLCLVQLSAGAEVYLLDALALRDVRPLAEMIGAADCTWVLHAGQQDVPLLGEWLDVQAPRVFDTQVAWSLTTIEHSASLAYLKYRLLGLRGEKAYQADDWRRRPLPSAQLVYAAEDVAHLPAIYRALCERCAALSRLDAAFAASAESLAPNVEAQQPLRLETFRNAWQLEPEGQAVLRFLIDWYNALDEAGREAAPDQKGLFSLASRRPRNTDELASMRAVPRRTSARFGKPLLDGIQRAAASAQGAEFIAIEPPPYASAPEILASGWLEAARAEVCVELGLAPELVLPSRVLKKLREAAVSSGTLAHALNALAGWRRELLFQPLSEKLARYGALTTT